MATQAQRIKLARFAVEYPQHKSRIVEFLQKDLETSRVKQANSQKEFAKAISQLVQEGEEDLIDDPSEGRKKKAAAPKKYEVKPYPGALSEYDLPKLYKEALEFYKDEKLVKLLKKYMEVDSEKSLERGWDKAQLLQKELFDRLESLNEEALEKRKDGMGFIKSRLWLRRERKILKKEILTKTRKLQDEVLAEQKRLIDTYSRKHPLFREAAESLVTGPEMDAIIDIVNKMFVGMLTFHVSFGLGLLLAAAIL